MTDFLRLAIDMPAYHQLVAFLDVCQQDTFDVQRVLSGKGGDGDWFDAIHAFRDSFGDLWSSVAEDEEKRRAVESASLPKPFETANLFQILSYLRTVVPEEGQPFDALHQAHQSGQLAEVLQRLSNLSQCTPEDVAEVLRFGAILRDLGDRFSTARGGEVIDHLGDQPVLQLPYPQYHPSVWEWCKAVSCTPFFIDPYKVRPGDKEEIPPRRFLNLNTPQGVPAQEFFAAADLDEVRQYMSVTVRSEHMCEGCIASEYESGALLAAFDRLEELLKSPIRLNSLCSIAYGKAKPSSSGTIPLVGSSGVYAYCGEALVHDPTLVIGRKGNAGSVILIEEPCWVSDTAFYLHKLSADIDMRYLYYALKWRPLSGQQAKTTMPSIQRHEIEEICIPRFGKDLQSAIALTLDAIQAARLARQREIELERERKAALMAHLFAFGTRNEPRRETPLGDLPESWQILPLAALGTAVTGKTPPTNDPSNFIGDIPFITPGDMDGKVFQSTSSRRLSTEGASAAGKNVPADSLMVVCIGATIGKHSLSSSSCRTNQQINTLVFHTETINPLYGYYAFQSRSDRLGILASRAAIPIVNKTLFGSFEIAVPDRSEQDAIATVLYASDIRSEALAVEAQLLDELFRASLEELMSGRLSVTSLIAKESA